ncbi:Ribosomal-protein-S18p-alanine acetyltransferase [Chitinispirillum alkaliphilum]|nr:Ribosomal-protein-S18p-alanine acetyltransferase [Chitinispirillum alkaliphilum]
MKSGTELTDWTIVRAQLCHIDAITRLELSCHSNPRSESQIINDLQSPFYFTDLIECSRGKVCAYISCVQIFELLEIHHLGVEPESRRKKLASMLISETLKKASQQGVTQATLEVRKSNKAAIGLYEKHGFEFCGIRKAYYNDGEDGIVMVRKMVSPG